VIHLVERITPEVMGHVDIKVLSVQIVPVEVPC
jgi:hypothetical protein